MGSTVRFTRFDWHIPAFREFRNSEAVQQWVLQQGLDVAQRAGSGYGADVRAGRNRAQCRVYATTDAADRDNRANNTILKAGDGGAA